MTLKAAPDLQTLRIGALLNSSSGSCDIGAERELEAILAETGLKADKVWCGGGDQIAAALEEVKGHGLDLLVVLGGDGTIRSAAETCSEDGPYLMPLPGGTMNMLPKAIYGELKWQDALRSTLAAPAVRPVSGGKVGERRFFVAAIVGNPSLWAEAREAMREGDVVGAFTRGREAMDKAFSGSLHYSYDGGAGEAEAVSVLCPLTSSVLSDDELALELAVIKPQGAMGALQLAFHSLVSGWRSDPAVETAKIRRVELTADEPLPAILDGETQEVASSSVIELIPIAFKALCPERSGRSEASHT